MAAAGNGDGTDAAASAGAAARTIFRGVTELVLDAKGRLAIPARHRDGLANGEGRVIITADHGGCLLVYPLADWQPIEARRNIRFENLPGVLPS